MMMSNNGITLCLCLNLKGTIVTLKKQLRNGLFKCRQNTENKSVQTPSNASDNDVHPSEMVLTFPISSHLACKC